VFAPTRREDASELAEARAEATLTRSMPVDNNHPWYIHKTRTEPPLYSQSQTCPSPGGIILRLSNPIPGPSETLTRKSLRS
jgi:hypothetical protein